MSTEELAEERADNALGYGTCPICKGPLETPDGFTCDACEKKVCGNCIHSYRAHYICSDCVALLSAGEKKLVKDAKELTKPMRMLARRTWLWGAFLLLLILPAALGAGYLFFILGRADYALGAILALLVLIWYWDRQVQNWA